MNKFTKINKQTIDTNFIDSADQKVNEPTKNKKKSVSFYMNVSKHENLKRLAKEKGMSIGVYLDLLIGAIIETNPKEKKKKIDFLTDRY